MQLPKTVSQTSAIIIASIMGIATGYTHTYYGITIAHGVSKLFINLLELISIPLIFLSIVSTISGMESFDEMKKLGKKILKYTLLTTIISASIALILFLLIKPSGNNIAHTTKAAGAGTLTTYFSFLSQLVPSNLVQLFSNNSNVAGVVVFAILLSVSILHIPHNNKAVLHNFFSSMFAAILKITEFILFLMPLGVWSFVTLFVSEIGKNGKNLTSLALYLICVVSANLVQGLVVLPLLLWYKGISPTLVMRGMSKALAVAFFSKSSNTALPLTMKCAEKEVGVSKRVSSFALPLCSTINMNGCSAFILITVLFVATSCGMTFSPLEMVLWIFIATMAAVGNAGVPMGCYFLTSAFLASMNVPLYLLGAILPLYTIIDMIETTLNVWSDSCVAVIVDKELS